VSEKEGGKIGRREAGGLQEGGRRRREEAEVIGKVGRLSFDGGD
jgi:hypothetical protein